VAYDECSKSISLLFPVFTIYSLAKYYILRHTHNLFPDSKVSDSVTYDSRLKVYEKEKEMSNLEVYFNHDL